jgi:hypothetical protein
MPQELKIHFDLHVLTNKVGKPIDHHGSLLPVGADSEYVPVVNKMISHRPAAAQKAYHSPEGWRTPVDIPGGVDAHELHPVETPGGGPGEDPWDWKFKNDILEDSTGTPLP